MDPTIVVRYNLKTKILHVASELHKDGVVAVLSSYLRTRDGALDTKSPRLREEYGMYIRWYLETDVLAVGSDTGNDLTDKILQQTLRMLKK